MNDKLHLIPGGSPISTWVPIDNPAIDVPIALGDLRSFRQEDLIAVDQVLPDFVGEFFHVQYHPEQRWFWLSEQTPDEMTLFLSYDSLYTGNSGM